MRLSSLCKAARVTDKSDNPDFAGKLVVEVDDTPAEA